MRLPGVPSPWRRLIVGLIALSVVFCAGTVGYLLLGLGALDAAYQTVTTVATVGFREVEPFSAAGKVFTMVLILAGVGTTLFTLSAVVEVFVEGHIQAALGRRKMERTLDRLEGHTVICGWGRVGSTIAHYLAAAGREAVVIDIEPDRVAAASGMTLVGDATDDEVLRQAGIERASALVAAVDTDAGNLFITLSARRLNPGLFIVSRARGQGNEQKLVQAGADRVVNPQQIGGARMAAFVLQPNVAEFLDVVMHDGSLEFRLEEVPVAAGSALAGRTLQDAHLRARTGALVLARRTADGAFETNPAPATVIAAGDVLIAVGTEQQLATLCAEVSG